MKQSVTVKVNMINLEATKDIIQLLKNTIDDERTPMALKEELFDRLNKILDRARVISDNQGGI